MKRRWMQGLGVVGIAVLVLAAIMVGRAITGESRQVSVAPVEWAGTVDYEEALERLSAAIELPTVSPADENAPREPFFEFQELLEREFPGVHEAAQLEKVNDLTLHYRLEGRDAEAGHVVFLAHQDVVPVEAGTDEDWQHPPFGGVVADGYIWGRGTLDNKHNLMGMMEAAEAMLAAGQRPRHTVHFIFGHDEEIGGVNGAAVVAERLAEAKVDVDVVYDEGLLIVDGVVPGIEGPIGLVGITERGYLTVEIEARGEGGHSSMPPRKLAVIRLARALDKIDRNPRPAAIDGPTAMMFEWAAPEMNFVNRLIFRNLWLLEPVVLSQMTTSPGTNAAVRTTAAPTKLKASDRENVLPQRAVATVNFRIHPRDSIATVLSDLESLMGDENISVRAVGDMRSEPGPLASLEGPGFERLQRALGTVYPDVVVAPNVMTGAADARYFTGLTEDVYRFQPVILTGQDLERIHGTDERLEVAQYRKLIDFYSALLSQW